MKIVIIAKYYDGFVTSLNSKILGASVNNYDEAQEILLNESSSIFAPFIYYFRKMGHSAELIVPNFQLVQNLWLNENDHHSDETPRDFDIEKKQIKLLNPDILFLSSNFEYYGSFLDDVKPFVKKVCAWISCPFDSKMDLSRIDHIFTLFRPHYDFFRSQKISATLTHAGFDERILQQLSFEKKHELSFVGGIGGHHKNRSKVLRNVIKRTPLKIWGYGYTSKNVIKNLVKQTLTGFRYAKPYQGEAWGKDMFAILASSRITLNVHGDIAAGYSVNMRMFEATGVGTLLITELTADIVNFFEPGKEVVCYSSTNEAIEKINYYLAHEDERKIIAAAGQKRTLENYTYAQLAAEYIHIFEQLLNE
jgi:spore maturation protein CgeB